MRLVFIFLRLVCILFCCGNAYVFASSYIPSLPLIIDDSFSRHDVTFTATRVYAGNTLTLSTIQQHIDQWLPVVPLSPIPDEAKVWAKLVIKHEGIEQKKLTLVVSNNNAQRIEGYVVDDRGTIRYAYTENRFTELGHLISFDISPREQIYVFLAVDDHGLTYLPLSLWESAALEQALKHNAQYRTLYIGALFTLMFYFFLSYFIQHNVCRFWFAATMLSLGVFSMTWYGQSWPLFAGILSHSEMATLLSMFSLLAASKVTHYHLFRIPKAIRTINYTIAALVLILPIILPMPLGAIFSLLFANIWISKQVVLSIVYRDRRNLLPSVLYGMCWSIIWLVVGSQTLRFINEIPYTALSTGVHLLAVITAAVMAGIAIESSERNVRIREFSHQEKRIANLRQFYELFRSSAEGLYTASMDGSLMSVNKAMCQLFGYKNEEAMLKYAGSTRTFFANEEDRDLLFNELVKSRALLGREVRGKRRDGSEFWFSISCQVQHEGEHEYLYGSIFDITERKTSNLSLEYLATHDSLTGVLNRREFERILTEALRTFVLPSHLTLLYIDLDRFKLINDSCGHQAGDELIQNLATLIHDVTVTKGEVARLGGDEFAILFNRIDEDEAYICANKLLHAIQDYKFFYENRMFTLGASIGFLHITNPHCPPTQLLSMADSACYVAKKMGRNQIHRYSPNDISVKRYENEIVWLNKINAALEANSFALYAQPFQSLNPNGEGLFFEVLLRLVEDDGTVILPEQFLPIAERYNLGNKIDKWVIDNSFKWLSENQEKLSKIEQCNINLSGQSLADSEFKFGILNAFESNGIPYEKICFEITETVAIVKLDDALDFIKTFKNLGTKFALDDFGSGFSSYSYLKHLPVDCVKIDGTFVQELLNDPVNQAMVTSIHEVASSLKMKTVAEFVENEATLIQLGKVGVNFAQGFGIAHPMPLGELFNLE